jgi:hypothetical protein
MNSEEYYHIGVYGDTEDIDSLLLSRVKHLEWVLGCYRQGSIRSTTIVELIPLRSLQRLLIRMEELNEFEMCRTILDMMIECYPTEIK